MNILVINGSPKGKWSITRKSAEYMEAVNPDHTFEYFDIGATAKRLENDFSPAAEAIMRAEIILFSFPVYTFLAPSQLHHFMALLKAADLDLSGKSASIITTSKHFYDVTAHRYVEDCCADLGISFIKGLSADMEDLVTEKGREEARMFFDYLIFAHSNWYYERPSAVSYTHMPVPVCAPIQRDTEPLPGGGVIVTDMQQDDVQLASMVEYFRSVFPQQTRIININECRIDGGCLGCFGCATSGKCIYKDGFDEFLRTQIQAADFIIYAFSVKDHSMGVRFKTYDDRQFCNGHRTVTVGMPVGYIVSGSLSNEENLRTVLHARADVGGNFLCGIATDEVNPSSELDKLASTLAYALENKHRAPQTFWGVGGMKIFRDLIYQMRGMMRADHKFYKAHGQYDFPQKKLGTILKMYLVGALISSPAIKKKMGNKMNEGMIAPYAKVVKEAKEKNGNK